MGVDIHAVQIGRHIDLDELAQIGNKLSDWLLSEHEFTLTRKDWENSECYIVNVEKTGFFRQISGLVFSYKIELSRADHSLLVSVDDGDIRQQLVGLGIAWFIAWPILLTAGWGMFIKGGFRQTIFEKIEEIAHIHATSVFV
jgi:hypothetical protein